MAAATTGRRTQTVGAAATTSPSQLVTNQLIDEFADVFEGLGCIPGEFDITIDESVPPVIQPTRRVPLHLRPKLQQLLNDMERRGVLSQQIGVMRWSSLKKVTAG